MVNRKFFEVDEAAAKRAHEANYFDEYIEGNATAAYRNKVEKVFQIVDQIEQEKPQALERAEYMAHRYSRKLALYYNSYYSNEGMCPSIAISGGGNFPVKKKNRQNERRDTLMGEYQYLEEYAEKIEKILYAQEQISSDDENALELLEEKLAGLKERQELMKAANRAIRKKDTEKGDEELKSLGYTESQIKELRTPDRGGRVGYQSYELTNNNAEIRRISQRIESLKEIKDLGSREYETEYFSVVEDSDDMRVRLYFDGKPDEEVRDLIKSHGFKWAPSMGCWQRLLNKNAKRAVDYILKKLREMDSKKA